MHATRMGTHATELATVRLPRVLGAMRAFLKMHDVRFTHPLSASLVFAMLITFHSEAARADERPIASTTSQNGKVRVEVLSLKRIEGDLVTLRWQLVNDDNRNVRMVTRNARLIDLVARREYKAGLGSDFCNAESGHRVTCWATFQAPPPNTKTMAVMFYERFDMITGVPVTE